MDRDAVYDVQNLGTMMPKSGMNYPLACPPGAVLQAGANLWAGDKSSGTPSVRILADNSNGTWPTTGALLTLSDNCRLSGIAIDDGGLNAPLLGYTVDAVDIVGRDVAIDSHTLIQNGYININCALSGSQGVGLQVKDVQILGAVTDNVYIGQNCPNVRLIGDLNSGAGNRGVAFYGDDLTLADGAVEQSEGVGIDLETAHYVSITSNYIDHNGKAPPSSPSQPTNIFVNGGDHISICGNHIQGGGNSVPTGSGVYSSQIYLENPSENPIDSFSLCGNVYTADTGHTDVIYTPQYVFDAATGTVLTNSSINESPETQAVGVYSPTAAPLLPQLKAAHVPFGFISGLTLSNDSTRAYAIDIAPGEATDSTGSSSMVLPGTCVVDLTNHGNQGLDTGNIAPSTTYFFYLIATPGGGSPSCIASASATGPVFTDSSFTGTGYQLATSGSTNSGSTTIVNVQSIAGAAVGNPLSIPTESISSTISSFGTADFVTLSGVTPVTGFPYEIQITGGTPVVGMQIVDEEPSGTSNCIPNGTSITTITTGPTILTLSNPLVPGCTISSTAMASIAQAINLPSGVTTTTQFKKNIVISSGVDRLVGAVYTTSYTTTPALVSFKQDNDTFYLNSSVEDIPATGCSISSASAQSCQLSVPCGRGAVCLGGTVQVEALGRILGGSSTSPPEVLLSSLDQSDQAPTQFTSAPGFTSQSSSADTGGVFRVFTSTASGATPGAVRVRAANTGGATVYEVTDGWVFHR